VPTNFWFRHTIEAFLKARAEGRDWRAAVAAAEMAADNVTVLTHKDLRSAGVPYSRQHLGRLVRGGRFPPPFNL
jgi:hypothetical protein